MPFFAQASSITAPSEIMFSEVKSIGTTGGTTGEGGEELDQVGDALLIVLSGRNGWKTI
ncbi:hypothetical protein M378DRAFT_10128 [Amanita muscaria Koide BX008]|uniref:Uncharacterized protein n=1 Tax=Amanita muscaria (strain Koide BX008) TaxID=946122 RepID=A0A0C2WXB0_AMAMK|nr:hypothetical protein M378DRAFT_10128 [Amanita muscaria Koide BX008]